MEENVTFKALLIGNSVFDIAPNTLPPLKGPLNDVRILRETLSHPQVGLFKDNDIKVLIDLSQQEIVTEIESFFSNAKVNDQLFLYYSGHGILDIKSNLYLCARDTDPERKVSTGIADSQINYLIQGSASSRIIIVLDCCHSGRFKGDLLIPETLFGEGRIIISSTRARELAVDAQNEDSPSAFTKFFADALLSGEVDSNEDGLISITEIYQYIEPRLRNEFKQTPQMKFDEAIGEIVIGKSPNPKKREPPPPSDPKLGISIDSICIDDVLPGEQLPIEIIDVYNLGGGTLNWNYECYEKWITIERYSSSLKLHLMPKTGINRGRIYIREKTSGESKRIELKVTVKEAINPPKLEVSEDKIDFGKIIQNSKSPVSTIRIYNAGGGNLNPKKTVDNDKFHVELSGDLLNISVDNSIKGKIDGKLLIETTGGSKTIPMLAEIISGPILYVNPNEVNFGKFAQGLPQAIIVEITNKGDGNLEWDFEQRGDWFSVVQRTNKLKVSVDKKLIAGAHNGSIIVKSNGGDSTINVSAAPIQTKPPPEPPRVKSIAGNWQFTGGIGYLQVIGSSPTYQYIEYNMLNIQVGQGILQVAGNNIKLQGFNIISGQIEANVVIDQNYSRMILNSFNFFGPVQFILIRV